MYKKSTRAMPSRVEKAPLAMVVIYIIFLPSPYWGGGDYQCVTQIWMIYVHRHVAIFLYVYLYSVSYAHSSAKGEYKDCKKS